MNEINNLIRGLSPDPGAYPELNGKKIKIFSAEKIVDELHASPGTVKTDGKNFLQFAGTDGFIGIKELQAEGKKRMDVKDFLRGYSFNK